MICFNLSLVSDKSVEKHETISYIPGRGRVCDRLYCAIFANCLVSEAGIFRSRARVNRARNLSPTFRHVLTLFLSRAKLQEFLYISGNVSCGP